MNQKQIETDLRTILAQEAGVRLFAWLLCDVLGLMNLSALQADPRATAVMLAGMIEELDHETLKTILGVHINARYTERTSPSDSG